MSNEIHKLVFCPACGTVYVGEQGDFCKSYTCTKDPEWSPPGLERVILPANTPKTGEG